MMKRYSLLFIAAWFLLEACSSQRKAFNPERKYDPATLQQDYTIFRNILQEYHPSLYWFTSKDSMNYYFDNGYAQLSDSMTEPAFRNILLNVITKIRCGHTSLRFSKKYSKYLDTAHLRTFPLSFKVWPDSLVVIGNLNPRDSILRRGTLVTSINGVPARKLTDTFLNYLVTDGNALIGKYQTLSSRGSFGSLYRNLFGIDPSFIVGYQDPFGVEKQVKVSSFLPVRDTSRKLAGPTLPAPRTPQPSSPPVPRINGNRNIQIDTTLSSAYMTLNTFSRGHGLRKFFRMSFREMKKLNIRNLVVDVRGNGGGDPNLSTLLTKYLADHRFKIADSLYAIRRSGSYNRYIKNFFFYRMSLMFAARKKKDGLYHFAYFEKHYYKPKRKNHFNGDVYIITGGNSFSATTIFAKSLQHQKNVLIVGEETGGGAYGNTAWKIPDVKLPHTGIRFRLPLFRLVMDQSAVAAGRGLMPDIEAAPSTETIRRGIDPKSEKVRELIIRKNMAKQ